ncbi:MAG: heavy metal-binding domain-containing protein, partial [Thermoanaerobaculia bacterium]
MEATEREPLVTDPVCGMRFPAEDAAATLEVDGETIHFCSVHCKEKLEADPQRYLNGAGAEPPHHAHPPDAGTERRGPAGATYTCPMHPEVEQEGPGDCPKCGMALEPET